MTAQPHRGGNISQAKYGTKKRRPDSNDWRAVPNATRRCWMFGKGRNGIQRLWACQQAQDGSRERCCSSCRASKATYGSAETHGLAAAIPKACGVAAVIRCDWIQTCLQRGFARRSRGHCGRSVHTSHVGDRWNNRIGRSVLHVHLGASHGKTRPIENQGHAKQHTQQ